MNFIHRGAARQGGASLVVALAFLLIMAMLGVTVANVTNLQERMAGNTRDRDLALQAAEAALRDAEKRLDDAAFRGTAIAYDATNGNDSAFWSACFEADDAPCAVKTSPTGDNSLPVTGPGAVYEQPQYVVERKPDEPGGVQVYRVTARGVGGTEDTIVILQAEFALTP
jgi:type IV pilus assembly protein PilX